MDSFLEKMFIFSASLVFFILSGFIIFLAINHDKKNKNIFYKRIGEQENMPCFPEFPPGKGIALYPDRGVLIIKFPDNVKIIVEQEGCK